VKGKLTPNLKLQGDRKPTQRHRPAPPTLSADKKLGEGVTKRRGKEIEKGRVITAKKKALRTYKCPTRREVNKWEKPGGLSRGGEDRGKSSFTKSFYNNKSKLEKLVRKWGDDGGQYLNVLNPIHQMGSKKRGKRERGLPGKKKDAR